MASTISIVDHAIRDATSHKTPAGAPSLEMPIHTKLQDSGDAAVDMSNDVKLDMPLSRPAKNHPLKFKINSLHEEDDPWPIEWLMFNILNVYLQPDSNLSAEEAAQCLDTLLPCHRSDSPEDPKQGREDAHIFMLEMSDLIWKIARQISHDHESQPKLLGRGGPVPAWRDFAGWSDSIRHAFADTIIPVHRSNSSKQDHEAYINTNAFAARVDGADLLHHEHQYAFAALTEVTDRVRGKSKRHNQDCYVVAGAQWIIHAGDWWWSEIRWGQNTYLDTFRPHQANRALSPAQWVTWRRGFQSATCDNKDGELWAAQAAAKIENVMVAHGYTVDTMKGCEFEQKLGS